MSLIWDRVECAEPHAQDGYVLFLQVTLRKKTHRSSDIKHDLFQ